MKPTMLLPIIFFVVATMGCQSKEMKDARDFITLKDWKNAIEKLDAEIRNNPTNTSAYQLQLAAYSNLYFPKYSQHTFLNPRTASIDSFPPLNREGSDKLFAAMDRISILEVNALPDSSLFFRALYHYYEWLASATASIANSSTLRFRSGRINFQNRCDNELVKSALKDFTACSEQKSDISDDAYYWWYQTQCDTAITIKKFIGQFTDRYPNSEIMNEIDLMSVADTLRWLVFSFSNDPNSNDVATVASILRPFIAKYPEFQAGLESLAWIAVDQVVSTNRSYVTGKLDFVYRNKTGLIEYLSGISQTPGLGAIATRAILSEADYYGNEGLTDKQIDTYKQLLQLTLPVDQRDQVHANLGSIYEKQKKYDNAITELTAILKPSDFQKYNLWKCYLAIGNPSEADKLKTQLESSTDETIRLLLRTSTMLSDLQNLKISGLDATFDTYTVKITGYVTNRMAVPVYQVKIRGQASDQYGNDTKVGYDYIDIINPRKKSHFEVTLFYSSDRPSSIKYGARVDDYNKY